MKKICLLLIFLLCLSAPVAAENTYDITYSFEDCGYARVVSNLKWGLVNEALNQVLAPKWDYMGEVINDFRIIQSGGLYGFADAKGKQVIAPAYARVENFSEGLAPVLNNEGLWGFIDTAGDVAIPFGFTLANPFSDGLALVKTEEGYGYIDASGEFAFDAVYQEAYPFSEGYACVKAGDAYGYIDTAGDLVIPAVYELAFDFSEGFAVVKTTSGYGLLDRAGSTKIAPSWQRLSPSVYIGLLKATKNGKTGIINTLGETLLPFDYSDIGVFSQGFCAVKADEGWGYINEDFELVIEPSWDYAGEFSEGYAPVMQGEEWGYINTEGEAVIPPAFSAAGRVSHGYAPVVLPEGGGQLIDPVTYVPPTPPAEDEPTGEPTEEGTLILQIGNSTMKTPEGNVSLDAAPAIYEDYTLLPIRAVTEAIGGTVEWDEKESKVTLRRDSHVVILRIGDSSAFVDGRITILPVKPRIENGRTLIPLRFAAESLDCVVDWDPDTATITISY